MLDRDTATRNLTLGLKLGLVAVTIFAGTLVIGVLVPYGRPRGLPPARAVGASAGRLVRDRAHALRVRARLAPVAPGARHAGRDDRVRRGMAVAARPDERVPQARLSIGLG